MSTTDNGQISRSCHFIKIIMGPGTSFQSISLSQNYLAKWLSVRLRTKWFWVRVQLQSLDLIDITTPVFDFRVTEFVFRISGSIKL